MKPAPAKDDSLRQYCAYVRSFGWRIVATWVENNAWHAVLVWLPDKRHFQVEYFPFFVEDWGYQTSGYAIETYRLGCGDCKLPNDIKQKAMDFLVSEHGSTPITFEKGHELLVIVQNGRVAEYTWEMGIPHAEFVRRRFGELPTGAWVGTLSQIDGELVITSSKHIYGSQPPVPEAVKTAVRAFLKW